MPTFDCATVGVICHLCPLSWSPPANRFAVHAGDDRTPLAESHPAQTELARRPLRELTRPSDQERPAPDSDEFDSVGGHLTISASHRAPVDGATFPSPGYSCAAALSPMSSGR